MTTHICSVCSRDGLAPEAAVALSNGYRHQECPRLTDGDYHPFEHHAFPNGQVWYRDSDHTYWTEVKAVTQGRGDAKGIVSYSGVKAAEIPSPSGIAKFADPNPDLLMNYVLRVEAGDLKEHECALLDAADELGVNTDQPRYLVLRDCKGAAGTLAHAAAEDAMRHKPTSPDGVPEPARGYLTAVERLRADLRDFTNLQLEQVVYSAEHGFAGRFDARLQVPVKGQGESFETWLLDFKTSGYIGRAYHEQLHAYDLAAAECGVGASDRIFIVQLLHEPDEKGRHYYLRPARASRQAFLNSLAKYRDGKETDAATKADWKELVAA